MRDAGMGHQSTSGLLELIDAAPHTESGLEHSVIDRAAARLHQLIIEPEIREILIKKYGRVPEDMLTAIFTRVAERTQKNQRPVLYFPIDQQFMELECGRPDGPITEILHRDRTPLYRHVIGYILGEVGKTWLASEPGVVHVRYLYEHDFEALCQPSVQSPMRRQPPILKPYHNLGANLRDLVLALFPHNPWQVHFLVNISVVPNLPEGSVTVETELPPEALMAPDARNLEYAAAYAANTMALFLHSAGALKKTVAVPGWTLDILHRIYGEPNHPWNPHGWNEAAIFEDVRDRRILTL